MVISVAGNLIETKYIYRIGAVVGDNRWKLLREIHNHSLIHSAFEFRIDFVNENTLIVKLIGDIYFNDTDWWGECEEYAEKLDILKQAVEDLRNQVIKYWNPTDLDVPMLEFKPYQK